MKVETYTNCLYGEVKCYLIKKNENQKPNDKWKSIMVMKMNYVHNVIEIEPNETSTKSKYRFNLYKLKQSLYMDITINIHINMYS